ncbi:MAG: flavodoxin [Bacteroidales bacterium]|jgi:flavodoxin I|nr:flavodoxin [Bacteroidales bacterium]NCU35408.1 flavodoxin [Candidatus Falkowbacteria bacterium]MDD2632139.1 flavodoxin [Bacteroidales bacterium]MDD3132187.1 flavodoxin [Bacteroidales bacterium]MDD3525686.1 flavodoxin [Bacteroidales bacterium]
MEKNIGIFYGSSTGSTEKVAELICNALGQERCMVINVEDASKADLNKYPYLVLGTPTWEIGEMQEDWLDFIGELKKADLKKKKIAIFGLGDQEASADSFADGAGRLYDAVADKATIIGAWPTEGYDFVESMAVKDGKFVGLIIDEDNQKEKTAERVTAWVKMLKKEFK